MSDLLGQGDIGFQANLYDSGNPTRRWLHRVRHEWVMAKIAAYKPSCAGEAFDCGVGCGIYTRAMASLGLRVTGVDINPAFVAAVANVPNARAFVGDICRPKALDRIEFADLAVCSEVLEHVENVRMALATLHDSLAPGGHLVLTTPQKWSTVELVARTLKVKLVARLARAMYNEPVAELGHISLMTARELQEEIQRAGFTIVEHETFAFYLPGVAEFMGERGQRMLAASAAWLAKRPSLRGMLWTQAYVLRRSTPTSFRAGSATADVAGTERKVPGATPPDRKAVPRRLGLVISSTKPGAASRPTER